MSKVGLEALYLIHDGGIVGVKIAGSPFEDIAMIDHLVLAILSVLHDGVRTALSA
jgi:hypothetical protein